MEQEQPVPQPNTPPKPQPVIIHKNNNAPLVGAMIFLALTIGGAAYYLGTQNNNNTQSLTVPSPTQADKTVDSQPSITVVPTQKLLTFTSDKMKDLAYSGFSIFYPEGWVEKQTKDELTSTVTFTKGANEIKIHQGPMGGNQCVFEGEMPDGPANDYRNTKYIEIKLGSIILRRLESDVKKPSTIYSFCSNSTQSPAVFGIPTVFGVITYTVTKPNEEILSEMDTIVATLKTSP